MRTLPVVLAIVNALCNILRSRDTVQNIGRWDQYSLTLTLTLTLFVLFVFGFFQQHEVFGVDILLATVTEIVRNTAISVRIEIQGCDTGFVDSRFRYGLIVSRSTRQYQYVRRTFFYGRPVRDRFETKGIETREWDLLILLLVMLVGAIITVAFTVTDDAALLANQFDGWTGGALQYRSSN